MRSAHPHQARRSARYLVSAATIGCVSGAALVLAIAACSTGSSSPAAAISHPAGAAAPSAPASSAPATTAPAAFTPGSGFTSCGSGVYAGPHTSCPFALNVYQAATADGNTPIITAYSQTTGKSYSVALTSTNPVTYNGVSNGNTALIEWAATNAAAPSAAPATTAPATAAAVLMPVPGSAPKVTVWCGSTYGAFSSPSLTVWKKTAEYGYNDAFVSIIPRLKRQAAYMVNSSSPAATVDADTQSMCGGVISAFDNPPPVDLAQYKAAMDDFAQGAYAIHSGAIANDYGPSVGTAGKYFNSAIAELNAFLAAVGP